MTDWEQQIVRAENSIVWILAPWFAIWRLWRHR